MSFKMKEETIVLGGGCFWCLDATYKLIKGIKKVEEGYSGGHVNNPTDEQIYSQSTGHAEVVKLTFDPKIIALKDILKIFYTLHDPTTKDRQGFDEGPQYRSVVFYQNDDQLKEVKLAIRNAQKLWDDKIVTEVTKFNKFYPASEYHKDYELNRPDYCQIVINPKLAKLRSSFSSYLK
jgi:methionine-S-sulfoxide reductase